MQLLKGFARVWAVAVSCNCRQESRNYVMVQTESVFRHIKWPKGVTFHRFLRENRF